MSGGRPAYWSGAAALVLSAAVLIGLFTLNVLDVWGFRKPFSGILAHHLLVFFSVTVALFVARGEVRSPYDLTNRMIKLQAAVLLSGALGAVVGVWERVLGLSAVDLSLLFFAVLIAGFWVVAVFLEWQAAKAADTTGTGTPDAADAETPAEFRDITLREWGGLLAFSMLPNVAAGIFFFADAQISEEAAGAVTGFGSFVSAIVPHREAGQAAGIYGALVVIYSFFLTLIAASIRISLKWPTMRNPLGRIVTLVTAGALILLAFLLSLILPDMLADLMRLAGAAFGWVVETVRAHPWSLLVAVTLGVLLIWRPWGRDGNIFWLLLLLAGALATIAAVARLVPWDGVSLPPWAAWAGIALIVAAMLAALLSALGMGFWEFFRKSRLTGDRLRQAAFAVPAAAASVLLLAAGYFLSGPACRVIGICGMFQPVADPFGAAGLPWWLIAAVAAAGAGSGLVLWRAVSPRRDGEATPDGQRGTVPIALIALFGLLAFAAGLLVGPDQCGRLERFDDGDACCVCKAGYERAEDGSCLPEEPPAPEPEESRPEDPPEGPADPVFRAIDTGTAWWLCGNSTIVSGRNDRSLAYCEGDRAPEVYRARAGGVPRVPAVFARDLADRSGLCAVDTLLVIGTASAAGAESTSRTTGNPNAGLARRRAEALANAVRAACDSGPDVIPVSFDQARCDGPLAANGLCPITPANRDWDLADRAITILAVEGAKGLSATTLEAAFREWRGGGVPPLVSRWHEGAFRRTSGTLLNVPGPPTAGR